MDKYNIPGVKTFEFTKIVGIDNIEFGDNVIIDDFVFIYATNKMVIGNYIHIASFTSISGGGNLYMEDFSGLSSGVRVVTGTDDFKSWGFGNPTIPRKYRNVSTGSIHIGKFSIVGSNSVILPDVYIAEGVAVAANSLITKNLEPWSIYIGNKKVGERDKEGILQNYHNFIQEIGG